MTVVFLNRKSHNAPAPLPTSTQSPSPKAGLIDELIKALTDPDHAVDRLSHGVDAVNAGVQNNLQKIGLAGLDSKIGHSVDNLASKVSNQLETQLGHVGNSIVGAASGVAKAAMKPVQQAGKQIANIFHSKYNIYGKSKGAHGSFIGKGTESCSSKSF